MKETERSRKFVKELNAISPRCYFVVNEVRFSRGRPDVTGVIDGIHFAIEMKTENYWKKRPGHALQIQTLLRWNNAGSSCWLLKTDEDRVAFILTAQYYIAGRLDPKYHESFFSGSISLDDEAIMKESQLKNPS